MRNVALLIVAISGFTATLHAAEKDLELGKFAGSWKPVSYIKDGEAWPEEKLKTVTLDLKGAKSSFSLGDSVTMGEYKLNPGATPKQVDITLSDGPHKGKTLLGIYEFKGDELWMCLSRVGSKERPTQFKSEEGSGATLEVWKRHAAN
jgi:uncharacterized protein (TIGR03067 family)